MARKRGRKSAPISGRLLAILPPAALGLIYLAYHVGLIDIAANKRVAPLEPTGPTNAGEIYRQQMEKKSGG